MGFELVYVHRVLVRSHIWIRLRRVVERLWGCPGLERSTDWRLSSPRGSAVSCHQNSGRARSWLCEIRENRHAKSKLHIVGWHEEPPDAVSLSQSSPLRAHDSCFEILMCDILTEQHNAFVYLPSFTKSSRFQQSSLFDLMYAQLMMAM